MAVSAAQQVDEVLDHLDNLDSLCRLFFHGKQFAIYKSVAVSLRLLLPGSSGDAGLVHLVIPAATLSPLRVRPSPSLPPDHLALPAETPIVRGASRVTIGGGVGVRELNVAGSAVDAMSVGEMLDTSGTPLPLIDWLAQPFLRPDWTLRSFISTVASKDGGAHLNPNSQLITMQKWGYFHWHLIAGLARSVSPQIEAQLRAAYPTHIRAIR